jgi:hypothetical protein
MGLQRLGQQLDALAVFPLVGTKDVRHVAQIKANTTDLYCIFCDFYRRL